MNPFFSIKRFADYSRKQYSENRKAFLSGALLIVLTLACCFWGCTRAGVIRLNMVVAYTVCALIILSVCFLQWSTRVWRDPSRGMIYNLTPVSEFEKYGFAWLTTLVGLWLCFAVVFWTLYGLFGLFFEYSDLRTEYSSNLITAIAPFLLGHALAFFFFTAVRRHVLAAYIAMIVCWAFIVLFPMLLDHWGVLGAGNIVQDPLFASFDAAVGNDKSDFTYTVSWIPTNLLSAVKSAVCLILAAVFWTAGYFKFKEKQIN